MKKMQFKKRFFKYEQDGVMKYTNDKDMAASYKIRGMKVIEIGEEEYKKGIERKNDGGVKTIKESKTIAGTKPSKVFEKKKDE